MSEGQIVSVKPVVLAAAPGRGEHLQVRVSVPAVGGQLPVIVFSHGFSSSMSGYDPLVDYWASHGFAVIQPTHLDSKTLGLAPEDPRTPLIWRHRIEDLKLVLDQLDVIEAAVPGLGAGTGIGTGIGGERRFDRSRIAAVGHSWGAQTVSMLLGARVLDADGRPGEDMSDARIKAAVLLATAGTGGADLTPFAAEHFSFMNPDFTQMKTPALVVAGDKDQSMLSVRGPEWFTDAYFLSPGGKSLLTLFGAEHSLGGITGYTTVETTDENPGRVALLRHLAAAYLRSALYPGDASWAEASSALKDAAEPLGRVESN